MQHKAYKFRLYPNKEQAVLIDKTIGCARKIYNLLLADRKDYYKKHGSMLKREVSYYKNLEEYSYLKEVDSSALANAKLHLEAAYRNFFSGRAKFPKFKVKGKNDSYTTNRIVDKKGHENICITGKNIKLPKLGFVRMKQHRIIPVIETIKSCTISKKAGKYYISVLVEYDAGKVKPVVKDSKIAGRTLGLDYSVPDFYVDSEGRKPGFPMAYRKSQKRLASLQRRLSRKKKGSANRQKAKLRVQRMHDKIANQRLDFCHKESRKLADSYDAVCLEDINLKAMSQTLKLGKSVMDSGFGMFRKFLKYKMEQKGGYVVYIDKWFPSTQLCNCCGYKNTETKNLKVRAWICPQCGTHHDRDVNSALNIKKEGLGMLWN